MSATRDTVRSQTADHVEAGFGGQLGWGRHPAMLMIDMMDAYFRPGSPLCLPDRALVDRSAALLDVARSAGVLVVHTRVEYSSSLVDAGLFVKKVPALRLLTAGHPEGLGRFVRGLEPRDGEIEIVKQYASAFHGTSLAATLTANGIDTVIVAGVSTSGCIRATATDTMQYGFIPKVVGDACGDRNWDIHKANLFDLGAKYADIVDLDAVSLYLGAASYSL